jgi:hypothetical protein
MKTRMYYLVDSKGKVVTRIRLAVDCLCLFIQRYPQHKLIRHLPKVNTP